MIEARAQLRGARAASAASRVHDDVRGRQLALAQPECLAHHPPDAVALDGAAGGLHRDGESQPRLAQLVRARDHGEVRVGDSYAARMHGIELRLVAQLLLRSEREASV